MKLNLENLKVQSFVTSLDDEEKQNVKCGLQITDNTCAEEGDCHVSYPWLCPTDYNYPTCGLTCGPCC